MSEGTAERTQADELRRDFHGDVLDSGHERYEVARAVFNGAIDIRPRLIAQCADAADVRTALRFARQEGLEVGVRCGGHSVNGACLVEDGLVIDLRKMHSVVVDPDSTTVVVGGGAIWSEVDRATQPYGLAMTGGRVSTTGVGGLTLGGGSGWLERKFGLACDHLLSAEVVTADGQQITASEREHPDLFWALRGGGGNFGIVTSFMFRLNPLPAYSVALMLWPAERGRTVAHAYRAFFNAAANEFGGGMLYLTAPPEPFVPDDLVGQLACGVLVTCVAPETVLRQHIQPLLDLEPEARMIGDMPYADAQCMIDDPPGMRNYWTGEYLSELPDEALEKFCAAGEQMITPSLTQYLLVPWGGAVARNAGSGPIGTRDAPWVTHPFGMWADPADDERGRAWARAANEAMRPWATGATYLNFVGDEGRERIVASFGRENYERLTRVKAEYDPENVFHRWHNVRPEKPLLSS